MRRSRFIREPLWAVFWFFPVADFQITQPAIDRLEVALAPSDACADEERLRLDIAKHVRNMAPDPIAVEVRTAEFDRHSPLERYVSLVKGPALKPG